MFAIRNLSVLAYAQGFTHWVYQAATLSQAQVSAPGFFNPSADMLRGGDIIYVTLLTDGALQLYVQSAPEAGNVTVVVMSATPAAAIPAVAEVV